MDEDEKFIIDEEAAPVVQQIYQLCLAGNGPTKICLLYTSSYGDHLMLRLFCRLFGVSKTTASIRLRQLGYMVDRPFSEYVDPLEVW